MSMSSGDGIGIGIKYVDRKWGCGWRGGHIKHNNAN